MPEDQGNQLFIEFYKSFYDTDELSRSEVYTIELLNDEVWVTVMSFGAYGADTYTVLVPTLHNNQPSDFRIIAGMDEGNFQTLESVSGISEDNIDPSTPENLDVLSGDQILSISWDYNQDIDFDYHQVNNLEGSPFYTIDNNIDVPLSSLYCACFSYVSSV